MTIKNKQEENVFTLTSLLCRARCLKDVYEQNRMTGKTQTMLYIATPNDIVIMNRNEYEDANKHFKEYKINPVLDVIDSMQKAKLYKDKRVLVDHKVVEDLLDDILTIGEEIRKDNKWSYV